MVSALKIINSKNDFVLTFTIQRDAFANNFVNEDTLLYIHHVSVLINSAILTFNPK